MKNLTFSLIALSSTAFAVSAAHASPISEAVVLDAVEVFEIEPGDREAVCARFAGDSTPLIPGSIDGVDFVPVKGSVARLKKRVRRASGARGKRLQRRLRKLRGRFTQCRREEGLSPLVVEEFGCGHRLSLEVCTQEEGCKPATLATASGAGSSVQAALAESQSLCELLKVEYVRYGELVEAKLGSSKRFRVPPGGGCTLFGCGIVPEGRSWNIHDYFAAGTVTACKSGNQCEEILVEGVARQPSWELARDVAVADCQMKMEEMMTGLVAFDGYLSAAPSIQCYPTVFSRKLGLK